MINMQRFRNELADCLVRFINSNVNPENEMCIPSSVVYCATGIIEEFKNDALTTLDALLKENGND